jgi:Protein of unknown function (DUF4231)
MRRRTKSTDPKTIDAGLPATFSARLKAVLGHYEENFAFYQEETIRYSRRYHILVIVTLAGSSLTPILMLSTWLDSHKQWQALPSAIGARAAALNAAFRYRQAWAQGYFTFSALANEYERFTARAQPDYGGENVTEEHAVNTFQNRMSSLVMSEVGAWRNEVFNDNAPAHGEK